MSVLMSVFLERYMNRQLKKLDFEEGEYNIVDAITILKLGELGFSKEEIQQIIEDSRPQDPGNVDPDNVDPDAPAPGAADPGMVDQVMSALEKRIDDLGAKIENITQDMEKSAVREAAQNSAPISQDDAVAKALETLSGVDTPATHEMYAVPQ